jgi:hypothetical protein
VGAPALLAQGPPSHPEAPQPQQSLRSHLFIYDADSTSYFHGWSPDNKTLAFVAQGNGSGQYDIYSMPAGGGPEKRLTENIHQDDRTTQAPSDCSEEAGVCSEQPCLDDFEELRSRPAYDRGG